VEPIIKKVEIKGFENSRLFLFIYQKINGIKQTLFKNNV
jgi:hypothetical protein